MQQKQGFLGNILGIVATPQKCREPNNSYAWSLKERFVLPGLIRSGLVLARSVGKGLGAAQAAQKCQWSRATTGNI